MANKTVTTVATIAVCGAVAIGGFKWYRDNAGAEVGEACDGSGGCVKGADCMVSHSGILPPMGNQQGRCLLRCNDDSVCPAGTQCSAGHCMQVAAVNQPCDGYVGCAAFGQCLSGVCRGTCSGLDDERSCDGDTICTPVNTGAPATPFIQHFCMPDG